MNFLNNESKPNDLTRPYTDKEISAAESGAFCSPPSLKFGKPFLAPAYRQAGPKGGVRMLKVEKKCSENITNWLLPFVAKEIM